MAFTESWVETDPDGSVITVSQLDDFQRASKRQIRERLEGDPANLNLSGVYEAGSFAATAIVKKGVARAFVDTAANIGTYPLQDGRLFIASDTGRMYHLKGTGAVELQYLPISGGSLTGSLTISKVGLGTETDLVVAGDAGQVKALLLKTATANRWAILATNTAESGANAGSDLAIWRYDDAGVFISAPLLITRSTGLVTLSAGLTVSAGGVAVTGASTFSSTINGQTISAAASFTGTVTVATGLTVSAGGANITGNSTVTGTLAVSSTINGQTISATANFTGSVTVAGALSSASLAVAGNGSLSTLTVTSTALLNSDVSIGTDAGGNRILYFRSAAGSTKSIFFLSGGTNVWRLNFDVTDNFTLGRYVAGVFTDSPIAVAQATGAITLTGAVTTSSTINGQTISVAASFTGTLAVASTINGQTISAAASFTGTVNAATGYRIGGAAAAGNYLRGNGTNFVSSAIQSGDMPALERAKVLLATNLDLTQNVLTPVPWDAEEFDNASMHDNVTNNTRITIPTTGTYLVEAYMDFKGDAANRDIQLKVRKNGVATDLAMSQVAIMATPPGGFSGCSLFSLLNLTAGDYIELYAQTSAAVTPDVQAGVANAHMTVARIP